MGAARICRENGWVVGTVLCREDGRRIRITAIGESAILTRLVANEHGPVHGAAEVARHLVDGDWSER